MMIINLDCNSPWHATYRNEAGQLLYKAESTTALTLTTREFTLYRVVAPNNYDYRSSIIDSKSESTIDLKDDVVDPLGGEFKLIGQIVYDVWLSSKSTIKFCDEKVEAEVMPTKTFFRKTGWNTYGRNHTFTAPDGKEYTWKYGFVSCSLYQGSSPITDDMKPIVKYNQRCLGVFGKAHSAMLEIEDGYDAILDSILLTFIFIEKLRKEGLE